MRERLQLFMDQVHIKQENIKQEGAESMCVFGVMSLLHTHPCACLLPCVLSGMQSCLDLILFLFNVGRLCICGGLYDVCGVCGDTEGASCI